ncbi:MAG TPA: DNA methyltransferase [Candidatus Angelobacter sp.]|jgi:type II restriction/modification system DNA methylase subunit YeeA
MPDLTLTDFVARWRNTQLRERAGAHSHFIDLCDALGQPRPAEIDQTGETYTFDKGVSSSGGRKGFADVWYRGHFAWEYKGKHKDLNAAYDQLLRYHDQLDNPPLLVVCDFNRFEVYTKFTGSLTRTFKFYLDDLIDNHSTAESRLRPVEVLRALFIDPSILRFEHTPEQVTQEAARKFAELSDSLRVQGNAPEKAAHFLMRILFCLFAEAIGLLPGHVFSELVHSTQSRPKEFTKRLKLLFAAMAGKGGSFGAHDIRYFDGGLFLDDAVVELVREDMAILKAASTLNWSTVEPAIFGTLFERSLDPDKRSQLGAHYTSLVDIQTIIEPVLMKPLRRKWLEVKSRGWRLSEEARSLKGTKAKKKIAELRTLLKSFAEDVAQVRVLDPACGSGNFLYVALKSLLDLEKEISFFAASNGISGFLTFTHPQCLYGIENNIYAHELASVVVWIGYIQWQYENGVFMPGEPVLRPLDNIKKMDAVMAQGPNGKGVEPEWPAVDVIIGNPPFLGGNKVRQELGDKYVDALFKLYEGRVPAFSDYVCYWFEKARYQVEAAKANRVGLLATQGIRGGVNRVALERIKGTGDIFFAVSDREWILDGAMVHVSMVGFDRGEEFEHLLDGTSVSAINSDLTSNTDVTAAKPLAENFGICFMGPSPKAKFDIGQALAKELLDAPLNINGQSNEEVVRPVASAVDLVQNNRKKWTIDFGMMTIEEAAQFEAPFEYVKRVVRPSRLKNQKTEYGEQWWLYGRPRPAMRTALAGKQKYIATPAVSKHRIFVWIDSKILCNQGTLVFTRDDDYFFGVLQSRIHEIWARAKGTQLREEESGFRYTPTSTFETFPFPWSPGVEDTHSPEYVCISAAAREVDEKRQRWLMAPITSSTERRARTLTALYNLYPEWLKQAHDELDAAVTAAYGWPQRLSNDQILKRLLALNIQRRSAVEKRPEVKIAATKKRIARTNS